MILFIYYGNNFRIVFLKAFKGRENNYFYPVHSSTCKTHIFLLLKLNKFNKIEYIIIFVILCVQNLTDS